MKKITIIFVLTFLMAACSFLQSNEEKAIEICQKARVQFGDKPLASLLWVNSTWLDWINAQVKNKTQNNNEWKAESTREKNIYLVSFVDEKNSGHRWEVDIQQKIVKFVSDNPYLLRKYDLSFFDFDSSFIVTNITMDTLKLVSPYSYYSDSDPKKVVYVLKASVVNKTGKTLTDANISGKLQVIFKDKTVDGTSDYNSGFETKTSTSRPWNPETEKDFYLKTEGIETVYLNYEPEYVFFEVNLRAEDPVGFSYDKNIAEYDLKKIWKTLK